MIEFVGITKKFKNNFWEKEFLALDNVSFKIHQGDLVGFLGANGAGKTTLIKCLLDFSRQSSGAIVFDKALGGNLHQAKKYLGYLPERAYLYQHLTGREFLQLSGNLYSIKKNDLDPLVKEWTEKINIAHALDRPIKGYSKGMQQRLGFVSCLIHRPKILILDEPLSGLDPLGRRDFKNILKELNQSGVTIFFSSHIVGDVEQICNSVVFIEKGKLIYNGDISALMSENVKEIFSIQFTDLAGQSHNVSCKAHEKDQMLVSIINAGGTINELEKDKITLEEIIYKIKQ